MVEPGWLTLATGWRAPGQNSARLRRGRITRAGVVPPNWWIAA